MATSFMVSKEELQRLISKSKRTSSLPSRMHFLNRLAIAVELLSLVKERKPTREISIASKKNFIVTLVTCFEVYFKDVIIEKSGRWFENGFNELLKEKITLLQALEYTKVPNLIPEHLITLGLSFKNPDAINRTFSALTQKDFFNAIDNYEILVDGYEEEEIVNGQRVISLRKLRFDWKKVLYSLYDLRNKIVHDDSVNKFSNSDLENYQVLAIIWPWIIQDYLNEHLPKKTIIDHHRWKKAVKKTRAP